jgi:leucyl aminopeptidase
VTFDTGGISIKPSAKMEDMKHDMTGAATVFGATLLASKLKIKNRVVCVMGFVENMPSGHATTPSSIVRARNGKTVEIINTDAEGRLVLGDALDLAQDYAPDCVINAATLTGAVGVALGKVRAGVMTNSQPLLDQLVGVANLQHERVWQLPLDDEYFEDIKTPYADMMNSANNPLGGTIRGGIFLKQFIRPGTPWVHMDIAYTANDVPGVPYLPARGGTGMHVRTLAQFAEQFRGVDQE